MRTEIVIPFAFDTEPLEQAIQSHGEEEVMRELREADAEDPVKYDYALFGVGINGDWKE